MDLPKIGINENLTSSLHKFEQSYNERQFRIGKISIEIQPLLFKEVNMSMRIQETMQNCCKGITDFATNAVNWAGRTISAAGAYIAETAQKVAEFVKPHFEAFMNFCRENKGTILVALGAAVVGALSYALFQALCCNKQATPPTTVATTA